MSGVPRVTAAVFAALILVLTIGVSSGTGAPNPCPGNYAPHSWAPESHDPLGFWDANENFIVCVYQGSNPNADPVRDDRLSKK